MIYDIIIIGGGAAGLAAAQAAWDPTLKLLLIEKENDLGGILNQCIHNGFGLEVFHEELTGPEYANRYMQSLPKEVDICLKTTVLDITKTDYFTIKASNTEKGPIEFHSKAVLITSGCYERTRGAIELPGERPKGIITAGSAQRYLNIDGYLVGKQVFILGSGDIGLIMARRMTLEGAQVLGVAEIMPYSNGLTRNIVQCLHDFSIPLYVSHTVVDIKDKDILRQVTIQQVDEKRNLIPGTCKTFDVDTLLLSVGLIPDIALFDSIHPTIDAQTKSMIIDQHYQSSIEGLFVAGNALHVHDLVDYVSQESGRAGQAAKHYVQGKIKRNYPLNPIRHSPLIRYIVPQTIDYMNLDEDIVLLFRVVRPMKRAIIRVLQGQKQLNKRILQHLVPSEMVKLIIPWTQMKKEEPLSIEMEELGI